EQEDGEDGVRRGVEHEPRDAEPGEPGGQRVDPLAEREQSPGREERGQHGENDDQPAGESEAHAAGTLTCRSTARPCHTEERSCPSLCRPEELGMTGFEGANPLAFTNTSRLTILWFRLPMKSKIPGARFIHIDSETSWDISVSRRAGFVR